MFSTKKTKQPNKWTFILIRDERRSSIQFRIRPAYLLAAACGTLGLVLALAFLTLTYQATVSSHLQARQEIDEKDAVIESLQHQLISLSLQTETMQEKLDQLETFEEEINRLVRPSSSQTTSRSLATERNLNDTDEPTSTAGIGGEYYGTSYEELEALTAQIQRQLDHLEKRVSATAQRLQQTRSLAAAFHEKQRITPNIWPTDSKRITSRFGYRRDPFTKRKSFHAGIDIGGRINDPIYATAAGKVVASGYQRASGYYITIDHGNGLQTRYMHLNKILVQPGTWVEKGQRIGLLGNTGRSTGPHLHYEIIQHGQLIDPLVFLESSTR